MFQVIADGLDIVNGPLDAVGDASSLQDAIKQVMRSSSVSSFPRVRDMEDGEAAAPLPVADFFNNDGELPDCGDGDP